MNFSTIPFFTESNYQFSFQQIKKLHNCPYWNLFKKWKWWHKFKTKPFWPKEIIGCGLTICVCVCGSQEKLLLKKVDLLHTTVQQVFFEKFQVLQHLLYGHWLLFSILLVNSLPSAPQPRGICNGTFGKWGNNRTKLRLQMRLLWWH